MTEKERKSEAARLTDRREEIARMSDAYLEELMRVTSNECAMLRMEVVRRHAKRTTRLVTLPCTLQDLETAIHSYGDHHGFHGRIVLIPASDVMETGEGVGVEEGDNQ